MSQEASFVAAGRVEGTPFGGPRGCALTPMGAVHRRE